MKLPNWVLLVLLVAINFQCTDSNNNVDDGPGFEATPPPIGPTTIDDSDLHYLPKDEGGEQRALLASSTGAPFNHFLYTPFGYENNDHDYPLLVFLHGGGQTSGNQDDLSSLNKLFDHGPPKLIHEKAWNPLFPFIVASPQLKEGQWPADGIHLFIEYLVDHYRVNSKRIYITGLSRGGAGTWYYVLNQGNNSYAAGIVPISGSGLVSLINKMKNTPVWAFHGAKDDIVSPYENGGSISMVKAINEFSPRVKARLTVFTELGHDAWTKVYDESGIDQLSTSYDPYDLSIYEWMLRHRKE